MAAGTGKIDINSELKRKKWMRDGMIERAAVSWWAAYKGMTKDSIIQQANLESADSGHTVVFDMRAALSGKAIKGNNTAKGKGEQKKRFSDKLVVSDYRYVVDNGTAFDGKESGDLSINEHADSRQMLADLNIRATDQSYFDLGQQGAEFLIDLGTTFSFDQFLDIETVVKTGRGFSTSPTGISTRAPLKPFYTKDGRPIWLMVIDSFMKAKLLRSTGAQQVFREADIRGTNNVLFSGIVGKMGPFVVVEAETFFGSTSNGVSILDSNGYYNFDNTEVEFAGMRQYDTVNTVWTGEDGFDETSTLSSRGMILGAGAFQKAMGKMPDYKYEGTDFDKFSESCLEVWTAAKCTKLTAESPDKKHAKLAGYNYGVIGFDVQI